MGITYLGEEMGTYDHLHRSLNGMVESRIKGNSLCSRTVFEKYALPCKYQRFINPLFKVMRRNKLKVRNGFCMSTLFNSRGEVKYGENVNKFYDNIILNPIKGSVGWHKDEGLGLLLNWLVYVDWHSDPKNLLNSPQLITEGKKGVEVSVIRPDYIFLFDANVGHAWISNWDCALIQVPVQPIK